MFTNRLLGQLAIRDARKKGKDVYRPLVDCFDKASLQIDQEKFPSIVVAFETSRRYPCSACESEGYLSDRQYSTFEIPRPTDAELQQLAADRATIANAAKHIAPDEAWMQDELREHEGLRQG
jgi:hypothetical protein